MQPALDETQAMLRDSIRGFLAREAPFARVRELERAGEADADLWAALHKSGWLALPFPAGQGGEGVGLVEVAIVVEELARRAALVPYAETMISALALRRAGEAKAAARAADEIVAGRMSIAPALLEASDSWTATPQTKASDGRLEGEKLFVDYAAAATHHLVSAVGDAGAGGLWLVARGEGVEAEPQQHIGQTPKSRVTYRSAPAEPAGGPGAYQELVRMGRATSAVQCVASAAVALEMTLGYVANRVQFGRPIATFQAVQHHCADMAIMVDSARFLAYEAAWNLDRGESSDEQIAVAKNWAARTAEEVTILAHQLHGGIGVTEEYDLNFFSRRAKDRALAWGTASECLALVAATADSPEEWV
jgi:alkylation response protein AidB-like acyl-CoA dehydrogenase